MLHTLPYYNRCCATHFEAKEFFCATRAHTEGHPSPSGQNLPFSFTQIPREGIYRRARRFLFLNWTRSTIFQMPSFARTNRGPWGYIADLQKLQTPK